MSRREDPASAAPSSWEVLSAHRKLFIGLAMLGITAAASLFGCGGETTGGGQSANGSGATGGVQGTAGGGKTGVAGVASIGGGTMTTGGSGGTSSGSGGSCPGVTMTVPLMLTGCNAPPPDPSPGQSLDLAKINVVYTNSTHINPQVLEYNPGCSSSDHSGWTWTLYTGLGLCEVTCDQLLNDPSEELFFETCLVPSNPLQ